MLPNFCIWVISMNVEWNTESLELQLWEMLGVCDPVAGIWQNWRHQILCYNARSPDFLSLEL